MYFKRHLIPFLLLLSLISGSAAKAQKFNVETWIDSATFCPGASAALPVMVKNMIGVDSFNLILNYDPGVVNFHSYFGLNSDLDGGNINVTPGSTNVQINWHRTVETSLFADTLLMLVFDGIAGSGELAWDLSPGACIYHSIGDSLIPGIYRNGVCRVDEPMILTLNEIDATCTGKCDANYLAHVTGGTKPYQYWWNESPGRFDSIQTNLCDGPNAIRIRDAAGCELDSIYQIDGLPGAKVEIKAKCKGEELEEIILYRENPTLEFSFDEISPTHVIEPPLWEFGDGDTARSFNPAHTYYRAKDNLDNFYKLNLYVKNVNGCDTVITLKIDIKDKKLKISNVIIPTSASDNNRKFTIFDEEGNLMSKEFLRFEVYIFDRWGRRLFSSDDYQNDWTPDAPNGVYYYVVKSVGLFSTDKFKGSVTILGGE